jgi:hypothetical protein
LQALADQTEFVRENNLPLSILETASGGTAGDPMRDESAADGAVTQAVKRKEEADK